MRQVNRRGSPAKSLSLPTATDGWVTSKNLGQMKPTEAIILDNWFPRETDITIRPGSSIFGTGVGGGNVETLHGYSNPTGDKLLAAGSGAFYDATLGGAMGAPLASGFANNQWQGVNMGNAAGLMFALLVNGVDPPQIYDGSTMSNTTLTGIPDPTTLVHAGIFKQRVFYIQKNSLAFWYHPQSGAVQGALSKFDLAAFSQLGGYLMAYANWTRDGGNGVDDYAAFLTSNGEVLIYQGSDPGDASSFALVGIYRIGAPLGRRCFFKYANDVAILNQDGLVPLGNVLGRDRTGLAATTFSQNIANVFTQIASLYRSSFGWQGILYPRNRMGIVNIPVGNQYYQYVINTNTGAWCRFTGLNSRCWGLIDDKVYFGDGAGRVWLFDDGTADDTAAITALYKSSFQYFGNRNSSKHFNLVRPVLISDGDLSYSYDVDVDYEDTLTSNMVTGEGGGTLWDAGDWDSFEWGDSATTFQSWQGANKVGRAAALKLQISTAVNSVQHQATDWAWQEGGIL